MIEFIAIMALMLAMILLLESIHQRKQTALLKELHRASSKSNLYLWALLDTMYLVEDSLEADIPGFDELREAINILEDPELLKEYQEEMGRNYDA